MKMQTPKDLSRLRLTIPQVEREFMLVMYHLHTVIVIHGVDTIADPPGFRIRSHDLHGPLPDAVIHDTGDRYPVLDQIGREGAKRVAMSQLRNDLVETFPGTSFLPPTLVDERYVVGIQWEGRTVLAEAADFVEAYHRLWRKAVGRFL